MELDAQFEPNGGGGGGGGTDNYNDLSNKPKINNVTLSGNKSASDLGLATPSDIPSVDATLTTQGAAADAKATGDAVTQLMGDLNGKLDAPSTAGTSGQVLTSDGQGGQSWQTPQSGGSVSPYTSNPSALGTASPGLSDDYARGDHVHPMPTAANVGAIASPSSPATGAFLVYNGSAWVAQTLATWQGGSY